MPVIDTMGNECSDSENELVHVMVGRCRAISALTGVLTPPQVIKLARWCVAGGVTSPDLAAARKAFPTLAHRSDKVVETALHFLKTDQWVAQSLRPQAETLTVAPNSEDAMRESHFYNIDRGFDVIRVECRCPWGGSERCSGQNDRQFTAWLTEVVRPGHKIAGLGIRVWLNGTEVEQF